MILKTFLKTKSLEVDWKLVVTVVQPRFLARNPDASIYGSSIIAVKASSYRPKLQHRLKHRNIN